MVTKVIRGVVEAGFEQRSPLNGELEGHFAGRLSVIRDNETCIVDPAIIDGMLRRGRDRHILRTPSLSEQEGDYDYDT